MLDTGFWILDERQCFIMIKYPVSNIQYHFA